MSEIILDELLKLGLDNVVKSPKNNSSSNFREFHQMDNDVLMIHQRYLTKKVEDCFWEYHEEHHDINIWLSGDEKILVGELVPESVLHKVDDDFFKVINVKDECAKILDSDVNIVYIPAKRPHKCVIRNCHEYIHKITFKIPTKHSVK